MRRSRSPRTPPPAAPELQANIEVGELRFELLLAATNYGVGAAVSAADREQSTLGVSCRNGGRTNNSGSLPCSGN